MKTNPFVRFINYLKALNSGDKHIKVAQNWKIWFLVPAVVFVLALVVGCIYLNTGFLNVGIDFRGGTLLTVEFNNGNASANFSTYKNDISAIIKDYGFKTSGDPQLSGENAIVFKYPNEINGVDKSTGAGVTEMNTANTNAKEEITELFEAKGIDVNVQTTTIGKVASKNLLKTAFISISVALALIFIYILIRFRSLGGLIASAAAILGLIHDTLILIAFTVIFQIQINSSFIAAIITIVSYSINNTIIVFDRVRENLSYIGKDVKAIDYDAIVNKSVTESVRRTSFSTLTTLFMIGTLAIFGVSSIQEFALPIIFGLFGGAFSCLFVAPSIWVLIAKAVHNKKRDKNAYGKKVIKSAVKSKKRKATSISYK